MEAAERDPWMKVHPPKINWVGTLPPCEIDIDHPIFELMEKSFEIVTGKGANISAITGATEASLLTYYGGTPSLVFGPGNMKQAHYPDEFVNVNDVLTATKVFAKTLFDWCGCET